MSGCSEQVKYFLTVEETFRISNQPCNILFIVWFQKISIPPLPPPHGGSRKFRGVEGCERGKFPEGEEGYIKNFFFPEGLKCDQIKHLRTFPIDSR